MKLLFVVIGLMAAVQIGFAQGVESMQPSSVTPKPVEQQTVTPAPNPHKPRSPRPEDGNQPLNPAQPDLKINAIIIVKSREEVKEGGIPNTTGVQVMDVPF